MEAQFKVEVGKDGKLRVVGKVDKNKLSARERALFNAITDKKNTATLNVVGQDAHVDFGSHDSRGVTTVDLADVAKLDAPGNAGGLSSGDVIAHEALEAYFSLSNEGTAHGLASQFFPGLGDPFDIRNQFNAARTDALGSTFSQPISDGRGSERIRLQFVTPIPAVDIMLKGARTAREVGAHIEEVTFVPKPKN